MKYNRITITGGTGFLGSNLIPHLLPLTKELRILGRNELKLDQLKEQYRLITPMICDIRDESRVCSCLQDSDIVIHAAALKRVTIGNLNPQEIIKTNVIGSMNVLHAVINHGVKKLIYINSDKAVNPRNLYGITKACAERMIYERGSTILSYPILLSVRYGNVIGSTGAFIPQAISLIKNNKIIQITDDRMTRFFLTKKDAINLVLKAIDYKGNDKILLPDIATIKKARIIDCIFWLIEYFKSKSPIKYVGRFSGEKLHEEISDGITSEEVNVNKTEFINMLQEEGLL